MRRRKNYRVSWTEIAVSDLEDILDFGKNDSPANTETLYYRFKKRAASLKTTPMRGRVVPELSYFGIRTWRELFLSPFRMIYRVTEDTVYVLAIFDGRRDVRDLLLERLVRSRET